MRSAIIEAHVFQLHVHHSLSCVLCDNIGLVSLILLGWELRVSYITVLCLQGILILSPLLFMPSLYSTLLVKCWTLGGERERVRVYIYTYTYIYTCTYALKLRKRRSTSRSTSSLSSFPVPLVSKTAPSFSLLWRFSSTSLPFLLSTSFQSRLTVPFLLCLH